MGAPPGPPQAGPVEGFDSDEAIAARTGCTTFQVQKLIREGHLRQVSATATHRYFRPADLDGAKAFSQRLLDIVGIRQKVSRLAAGEREAAFWAHVSAAENGRQRLTAADRAEGARRSQAAQRFDQAADRVTARIDQILERIEHVGRRPAGDHLRLRAVHQASGVLEGVAVMTKDLPCAGKFILVDTAGNITKNPNQANKRLQVWTDEESLTTLLVALEAAGPKLKVRTDHSDDVADRVGYADSFGRQGASVTCDLHLFASADARNIILETAARSPELLGVSVSFIPRFEIRPDRALLRVVAVEACDIVDEAAANRSLFPD